MHVEQTCYRQLVARRLRGSFLKHLPQDLHDCLVLEDSEVGR